MKEEHVWFSIIWAIVLIVMTICGTVYHVNRLALTNGYCEAPRIGSTSTIWVRCEAK